MIDYKQVPKKTPFHIYLHGRKIVIDISVEDWGKACRLAQTQTINVRWKVLQYKWLLRTYILHLLNYTILILILLTIALSALVPFFHCT